jgi:hypothetical protein
MGDGRTIYGACSAMASHCLDFGSIGGRSVGDVPSIHNQIVADLVGAIDDPAVCSPMPRDALVTSAIFIYRVFSGIRVLLLYLRAAARQPGARHIRNPSEYGYAIVIPRSVA